MSRAALRIGAGMVVCGVPGPDAAARVAGGEVVARALAATDDGALAAPAAADVLDGIDRFRALVIGPGLGRREDTASAVRAIVAGAALPVVVDADALHALGSSHAPLLARSDAGLPPAVLTPHAGEYRHLTGDDVGADRVDAARRLAVATRSVVLLKGPGTVVADPSGRATLNPTGGPALATAGTGDVLSGIIGGLLAQGLGPFEAAGVGAFVHGQAADDIGRGLVAGDLVAALPRTLVTFATDPGEG